ncbi:hypothetical protein [Streptomyces sp. NPDC046985]|uniref:hypothetical protein n=1 Tax=Streptomyces sp. NPDC046985 TaxID=3155377 RepID=UPI0033FD1B15
MPSMQRIPKVVCGAPIDPALTAKLVATVENWDEDDRVDRAGAGTAPCLVLSEHHVVMRFRFSWDEEASDLTYLATGTGSVSGVTDPRSVTSPYKTLIGTDGAIATTPCKTKGGNYFTLTLQLPQVRITDRSHRKDIEKFMRSYFPATVRTLGCAGSAAR